MVRLEQIPALGTYWWLDLYDASEFEAEEIEEYVTERLTQFNHDYTRFKAGSFVYTLNTERKLTNPPEELLTLLRKGKQLFLESDGAFNILTAGTQVARGYGERETVPESELYETGDPLLDLTIEPEEVTLTRGAVDLGGLGKGYLIDALAHELRNEFGIEHLVINGGGDLYATSQHDGSPVEVAVEHPLQPGKYLARIPLNNQGFAASSTLKRTWENESGKHHHIVTQNEAVLAAHIVAESALEADTLGTIACTLEREKLTKLFTEKQITFLLLEKEGIVFSRDFKDWLLSEEITGA